MFARKPPRRTLLRVWLITIAVASAAIMPTARSCPFCLTPPRTWAQMLYDSDVVVLAEFVSLARFDVENRAETRFRIRTVHRLPEHHSSLGLIAPDRVIVIPQYVEGKPGELFLLTGRPMELSPGPVTTFASARTETIPLHTASASSGGSNDNPSASVPLSPARPRSQPALALVPAFIEWDPPESVSAEAAHYILTAPVDGIPQRLRLPYYIPFLEHSDTTISIDAWAEFARSEYRDVKAVQPLLPRESLRTWIADPQMSPERLGLYGMLLGLCGHPNDADFLLQQLGGTKIEEFRFVAVGLTSGCPVLTECLLQQSVLLDDDEFRFGTDGLMGGYLLLTGEQGLELLESTWLMPQQAPLDEVLSAVYALRFLWSYEPDLVPADRLRQSMRLALRHSELQETAVTDLARWKDWQSTCDILELHDPTATQRTTLRRAVIEFARQCAASDANDSEHNPFASLMAELFLAQLPENELNTAANRIFEFVPPQ